MSRRDHADRGAVLLAVLVLSFLLAAAAMGAFALAWQARRAAALAIAQAQANGAARSAAGVAAQWFEAAERGSLVPVPEVTDVIRDDRRIDPDRDGLGPLWSDAAPPWNVRYRETDGALFRPGSRGPEVRFVGTEEGPDLLIDRRRGAGSAVLDRIGALLAGGLPLAVDRIALRGPPALAPREALATVEATAVRRLPGARVRVVARGEVLAVDWGRLDRPVVAEGTLELVGVAAWGRGEAYAGGDLIASAPTVAGWPGGIPWLAPDRPLRDDNDGDGTADDADGDGTADLAAWRALPGAVPDPWWRARIAGAWPGVEEAPAACEAPFPFGPRAVPPAAPSKREDRSGLFLACPVATPPEPIPAAWRALAAAGVRGAWEAIEDPLRPGQFRLAGGTRLRSLDELLPPPAGGLLLLRCGPTAEVALDLDGGRGAILADCAALDLRESARRSRPERAPGDPRDTAGEDRAGRAADDRLPLVPAGTGCGPWDVGPWEGPSDAALSRACPAADLAFDGLVAAAGAVRVAGPLRVDGQLRGASLRLDGGAGAVEIDAWGAPAEAPAWRPGPPGAPRVLLSGLRLAR